MAMNIYKTLISYSANKPSNHISPLLFSTSSKPRKHRIPTPVSEYLVKKHQFPLEMAAQVASSLPHLIYPEKCDSVFAFLKENGFSKTHLESYVTNYPRTLTASLELTIKPKIKIFQDLGFSQSDTADIISANPWMLMRSANNRILPALLVLKNLVGSVTGVAKLLKISGWFLKYDLEKTLLANIELMKSRGVDSSQLISHIFNHPRFFMYKPERLKEYAEKVDEIGFDKNSKLYLYAINTISSMSDVSWKRKVELFHSLGLSKDETFSMFRKRPQVFAVSERKIKESVKTIVGTGKYDMSVIYKHPGVLLCSVEDRLKPRLQVLEILEKKKLLKSEPGFSVFYVITNKEFIARFVTPNLKLKDLHETYLGKEALWERSNSKQLLIDIEI